MTIKRRLILSHVLTFIIPLIMTFFVVVASAAGLILYARSGNHIDAENVTQFQRISMAIHHIVFRSLREAPDGNIGQPWVIGLLNPEYNYVRVTQDEKIIYAYGNEKNSDLLAGATASAVRELRPLSAGIRYAASGNTNYYIEKQPVGDNYYYVYYFNQIAPKHSDEVFEHALEGTVVFIGISLILFIFMASWFLSRFVLYRILPPLRELQQGSEKVRQGDLSIRLFHEADDEFMPAVKAFNLMTEKLQESLQEQERQEENRKELIASISHDIRTPLTAIKAYAEGLLDHVTDEPAKQKQYLQVIKSRTDDLNRMAEQLFLLSKMDLGEKAFTLGSLDLAEELRKILLENELNWRKDGVLLNSDIPENTVCIYGSGLLVERILQNLISNSVKYKTAEQVAISVALTAGSAEAIAEISDDGPGVPEDLLPRLTDPFYRTDKARSRTEDGSGLGLSIVVRAMELMRGKVEITLARPHGLVIRLRFPLLKE